MTKARPDRNADAGLVRAALAGDGRAFGALYARWGPKLLRHACRILGETEAARDAAQDAWVDIHQGLRRLNDPSLFGVWCFRIVTRKCSTAMRKNYRARRLARDLAAEPDPPAPEQDSAALDIRAARKALNGLPTEQYLAMQLFYLESFSVAEVAVALDIPAGTVKTRLMHARQKLRAVLLGEHA